MTTCGCCDLRLPFSVSLLGSFCGFPSSVEGEDLIEAAGETHSDLDHQEQSQEGIVDPGEVRERQEDLENTHRTADVSVT